MTGELPIHPLVLEAVGAVDPRQEREAKRGRRMRTVRDLFMVALALMVGIGFGLALRVAERAHIESVVSEILAEREMGR